MNKTEGLALYFYFAVLKFHSIKNLIENRPILSFIIRFAVRIDGIADPSLHDLSDLRSIFDTLYRMDVTESTRLLPTEVLLVETLELITIILQGLAQFLLGRQTDILRFSKE